MNIIKGLGKIYSDEKITLVHFKLKKGDNIPKHNHIESIVFFNLVKGKIEITIDEDISIIEEGSIINFDGNSFISANSLEESEVYVTLLRK